MLFPWIISGRVQVRAFLAKTVPNPSRLGDPDEFAQLVQTIVLNRSVG